MDKTIYHNQDMQLPTMDPKNLINIKILLKTQHI